MRNSLRKIANIVCVVVMSTVFAHAGDSNTHMFGPTGIHGTVANNTITVTQIDKGSPADGMVALKSVIIGLGDTNFKNDVRREVAAAINVAETEEAGGKLTLILKDNKKVELKLMVLGSYSDTAPYNCPKSDKIIARAAESIVKNDTYVRLKQDLMGLLATGEQKYIDVVKAKIHADPMIKPDLAKMEAVLEGTRDGGYVTWEWGYPLILFCEYYLMTKDEAVLPAIEAYSVTLARGQDAGGLWGHRMIAENRNGRLLGYAQINQPSLTVFMGLLLAKKCGVDDPRLDKAIEKSNAFYASFMGRGAFDYGVHKPNTGTYNDNGTSATAALDMAFMGNKEEASHFAQMTATSYDVLEMGHAGHYFGVLWTPLGADLIGPEASAMFFKKSLWINTLYRGWDGRFTYDGGGYKRCSSTGSHLLWYCLGRNKLMITGKDADESIWLKGQAATDAVNLSQTDFNSKSADELLELVNHPMAQVRRGIGEAARGKRAEILPKLDGLYENGTKYQKIFACGFPEKNQDKKLGLANMDRVVALLCNTDEDAWVRASAAGALAYIGEPARKYYVDIVRMIAEDRSWDRFGDIDWSLGESVSKLGPEPFRNGLVTDKELHIKAALKLIRNKRQHARGDGLRMLAGIPLEDFNKVADDVLHIIEYKDRTYHSYHNMAHTLVPAISILADLNIKEGIDMAMKIMDMSSFKHIFRIKTRWECLAMYGGNAKAQVLELRKAIENNGRGGMKLLGRNRAAWDAMEKAVMEDKNPKKLITLEEARNAGK